MISEIHIKHKANSEFLKSLNFSEEFILKQLENYSISVEKIIFKLLNLKYNLNYPDDKTFSLDEETTRLYDYAYTEDLMNDFKIFETIKLLDKEIFFPLIFIYIDSYMFYDEKYSCFDNEDEYFDDYFLKDVKNLLNLYFEKDMCNFEGFYNFIDYIIRVFIGAADISDTIEYSEIKRGLKITIKRSLEF